MMYGNLEKSFIGAVWTFEAEDGTHHELTVIEEGDEGGVYHVRDTHGRDLTLLDVEDRAELLQGWSDD